MSDGNTPKKSEMLEIRIPHGTKAAFMQKAQAEGLPASEIVRQQIDAYLGGASAKGVRTSPLRRRLQVLGVGLGALVTAIVIALAVSPAAAQPDLSAAFASLDTDGDGVVSATEFIDPKRAHETSILGTIVAGEPVAIGHDDAAAGAYVRYVLASGTPDGDIPLIIAIEAPRAAGVDVPTLVHKAFDKLDLNGDGRLDTAEFGVR